MKNSSSKLVMLAKGGKLMALDSADTASLDVIGGCTRRRASHVVPVNRALRAVFVALRYLCGETGAVARLTRALRCHWRVDLRPSGGPILAASFASRESAIAAEIRWLEKNLLA